MNHFYPTYTDISNWNKKPYSSTGGTRAKNIYTNPEDEREYFFKCSKKLPTGEFRYPSEFWSEIIASKIGQWLDFDVLDYNIAFDKNHEQKVGCISKSMVIHTDNKLSEGIEFLRGFDPTYIPSKNEDRYTVDFIRDTLEYYELSNEIPKMVEMVIFDAIIGNSDRHQENWGFISDFNKTIENIEHRIKHKGTGFLMRVYLKLFRFYARVASQDENQKLNLKYKAGLIETNFSPIYDSGCCLGRELEEKKIYKMLADEKMIQKYISNGRSEIRLIQGKKKPKHFNVIEELKTAYKDLFKDNLKRISDIFNEKHFQELVFNVDKNLPEELEGYKLAEYRKEFISKLIPLRIKKIQEL